MNALEKRRKEEKLALEKMKVCKSLMYFLRLISCPILNTVKSVTVDFLLKNDHVYKYNYCMYTIVLFQSEEGRKRETQKELACITIQKNFRMYR
jgi:hypothetical protein